MKDVVVALVWPVFITALVLIFRQELTGILALFKRRVASGAGLKIGGFEMSATRIGAQGVPDEHSGVEIDADAFASMEAERQRIYEGSRRIMVVHRLFRSQDERHLFDIEIYCVPHHFGSLNGVKSVTYCFGGTGGWSGKTYKSRNRYNGFGVITSAYGPMLCVAKIEMSDGEAYSLYRYIDFEMGSAAGLIEVAQ